MRIAILQFPGSNCERETILAVKRVGMEPVPILWNESTEKLASCDGYVIVGGFAYEDRVRSGIIAALDPIMQIIYQANNQGKPILGICNGAQILVESGLVPGVCGQQLAMALARNKREENNHILGTGFYNGWVNVKTTGYYPHNAFLRYFKSNQLLRLPVAHGEGRFVLASGLWEALVDRQVAMLQYADINPNGSEHNLAAICNNEGNVMAIMPHPERVLDGDIIFSSMRDYILEKRYRPKVTLDFVAPKTAVADYSLPPQAIEFVVELVIQDNAALSLQSMLKNFHFNLQVIRYTHWEVTASLDRTKYPQLRQNLIDAYELFNPYKEMLKINFSQKSSSQRGVLSILVQDIDNIVGKYKHNILHEIFGITDVLEIKRGDLWTVIAPPEELEALKEFVFKRHVFWNPYSQNGYFY